MQDSPAARPSIPPKTADIKAGACIIHPATASIVGISAFTNLLFSFNYSGANIGLPEAQTLRKTIAGNNFGIFEAGQYLCSPFSKG